MLSPCRLVFHWFVRLLFVAVFLSVVAVWGLCIGSIRTGLRQVVLSVVFSYYIPFYSGNMISQ